MKSREIKPPTILWVGETALEIFNHVDIHVRDQFQHEFLLYEHSAHYGELNCTTLKNKDDTNFGYDEENLKNKIEDYFNAHAHKKYTLFIGSNFELLVSIFLERLHEKNKTTKAYKSNESYQEFMYFKVFEPVQYKRQPKPKFHINDAIFLTFNALFEDFNKAMKHGNVTYATCFNQVWERPADAKEINQFLFSYTEKNKQ